MINKVKDILGVIMSSVFKTKMCVNKVVILSDIHFPYNSIELTELALELIKDIQPTEIIINGDGCDMNGASTHLNYEKDSYTIKHEIGILNEYIQRLREASPKSKIVYVGCNHVSLRLERLVLENRHLEGFFNPDILIKCDEYVEYNEPYFPLNNLKVGIIHGFAGNKYCAGAYTDKYLHDLIVGHSHTIQQYTSNNGVKCYVVGAMCKKDMKYLKKRPTRLVQAFAVLELYNDVDYNLINIELFCNKIYYNGVEYEYKKD